MHLKWPHMFFRRVNPAAFLLLLGSCAFLCLILHGYCQITIGEIKNAHDEEEGRFKKKMRTLIMQLKVRVMLREGGYGIKQPPFDRASS